MRGVWGGGRDRGVGFEMEMDVGVDGSCLGYLS